MTEEIAETALAFCTEVLGWEDAEHYWRDDWSPNPGVDSCRSEKHMKSLLHTDLNAVMAATREWCKISLPDFYVLDVTYYMPKADVIDDTFIVTLRTNRNTIEEKSLNLCHALLSACVTASRKLKGAV